MTLGNLLTPWFLLAVTVILLVYVEKWIHSHLYGVGWLLTDDKKSATALYYVLLLPGVFVHEFAQYLVAGALNIKIKRVIAWPEAQDDGTLRLDFVQIKKAGRVSTAIIGAAPLIVGLALVWVISNHVLNLEDLLTALGKGDLNLLGPALQKLVRTRDFFLWLYLVFAISNAMLPTPSDRQGWPLVLGLFGGVVVFLVVIGVGEVLLQTFTGPVAHGVDRLATAFATVLVIEMPGIVLIGFLEEVLERLTKRKFEYNRESSQRRRSRTREPGSNLPLAPDEPFPSIYNLELPVPLSVQGRSSRQPQHSQRPAGPPSPTERARPEAGPRAAPPPTPAPRPIPAGDTPAPARTQQVERPAASFQERPPDQTRPPALRPAPAASQPDASESMRRSPFTRSRPRQSGPSPADPGEPSGLRRDVRRSSTSPIRPGRPESVAGPTGAPAPGRTPFRADMPDDRASERNRPASQTGQLRPNTPLNRSTPAPGSPFERPRLPTPDRLRPASPFMPDDDDEDDEDGELEYVPFDDVDPDAGLDDF